MEVIVPVGVRGALATALARLRENLNRGDERARRAALALSEALLASLKENELSGEERLLPTERSAIWLARAHACEAASGHQALEEGLRATAHAIAACGRPGADAMNEPDLRRALALAWMNRGNLLQVRAGAGDLDAAVAAYDQAIGAFAGLAAGNDMAARNSLGAAWLNRGQALQRLGTPADLRAARTAAECAIAVLVDLPLEGNRWHRANLAGARVNLANVTLALAAAVAADPQARRVMLGEACEAARAARATIAPLEDSDPVGAELGLKAWRILACALGECLAEVDTGVSAKQRRIWADEVSEAVEGGLGGVARWEDRGVRAFRPLAARLFRLGVQLYRAYQPQFLAEFALEALDPAQAGSLAKALAGDAELMATAEEAITGACRDLRTQHRIDFESENTSRLLETLASLETAARRLAELRVGSQVG